MGVLSYRLFRGQLFRILDQAGDEHRAVAPIVDDAVRTGMLSSSWIVLVVGLVAMIIAGRVMHRVHGPLVEVRRYLRALREGDYEARCRIRTGDKLHDIVDDLNALGATLQARHGNSEATVPEPVTRLRLTGT